MLAAVPSFWSEPDSMWGVPVLDTHLHLRRHERGLVDPISG